MLNRSFLKMPSPNESPPRQTMLTKFFAPLPSSSEAAQNRKRQKNISQSSCMPKFPRTERNRLKRNFFGRVNKSNFDATHTWRDYFFTATNNFQEFKVEAIRPIIDIRRHCHHKVGTIVATATIDGDSALTNIEVREIFRRRGIGTALIRFMKYVCPKFTVFGGIEENSRYRLTDEGAKLISHCQNKGILKDEDVIKAVSVPASLDS